MEKIAFICGGASVEREISCLTGLKIVKELEKEKIPFLLIYLDEKNNFYLVKELDSSFVKNQKIEKGNFVKKNQESFFKTRFKKYLFDKVLILGHGKNIEDGALSAYFNQIMIPCLGESIYQGVTIQDKDIFKMILKANKIKTLNSYSLFKYQLDDYPLIEQIAKKVKYPLIVKPSKLGSSIGINKVEENKELAKALFEAFLYDDTVIIEPFIENKKEFNIALIGYEKQIEFSEIEEVNHNDQVLSFYDKYDYSKSNQKRIINPEISLEMKDEMQIVAKKVFQRLNLCGIVRFDFIYDVDQNQLYLNEANLIPGSLAYYLFEEKYSIIELVNRYIEVLETKRKEEKLLSTNYKEGFINRIDLSKIKK